VIGDVAEKAWISESGLVPDGVDVWPVVLSDGGIGGELDAMRQYPLEFFGARPAYVNKLIVYELPTKKAVAIDAFVPVDVAERLLGISWLVLFADFAATTPVGEEPPKLRVLGVDYDGPLCTCRVEIGSNVIAARVQLNDDMVSFLDNRNAWPESLDMVHEPDDDGCMY
jgi:hypothetical protein